jgi:hypothetical protein
MLRKEAVTPYTEDIPRILPVGNEKNNKKDTVASLQARIWTLTFRIQRGSPAPWADIAALL